jgi:hypothetical protein
MVTVPVLVFEPAAMVSFLLVVRLKSEAVAGDFGVAETVSVTAWLETALKVAVTVLVPPSSEIDEELKDRDTVGVSSSSAAVFGDRRRAEDQRDRRRVLIVRDRQLLIRRRGDAVAARHGRRDSDLLVRRVDGVVGCGDRHRAGAGRGAGGDGQLLVGGQREVGGHGG